MNKKRKRILLCHANKLPAVLRPTLLSLSLPFSSAIPTTILADRVLVPVPTPVPVTVVDTYVALGIANPFKNETGSGENGRLDYSELN
jgi:hypothetical protein